MKELKEAVSKLATEELERSMVKFPLFNSPHEGYAVILEEVEEAEDEIGFIRRYNELAWGEIKHNDYATRHIVRIKEYAINLAAEAIQVAAMAEKYIESFKAKE